MVRDTPLARDVITARHTWRRAPYLQTSRLVGVFSEYWEQVVLAGQALAGLIEKDLQIGYECVRSVDAGQAALGVQAYLKPTGLSVMQHC